MHADAHIFGAPRATPGSVTRVCFRTYVRSRDAPDDPFRSGPRAFTIIHVNCPQHARSCPKSHAPWLHFAAGQTFRTVSESVLRRTSARGPDGALSSPHGNANPLYVRGIRFFLQPRVSRSVFANLTAGVCAARAVITVPRAWNVARLTKAYAMARGKKIRVRIHSHVA